MFMMMMMMMVRCMELATFRLLFHLWMALFRRRHLATLLYSVRQSFNSMAAACLTGAWPVSQTQLTSPASRWSRDAAGPPPAMKGWAAAAPPGSDADIRS